MKNFAEQKFSPARRGGSATAAVQLRWLVIGAIIFLVAGGWFYWRQTKQPVVEVVVPVAPGVTLSESTTRILSGLDSAIELRLFAPAADAVLPADLGGYLARVESLLAEYERVAAGKLRLVKSDPQTDRAAKAAAGAAGVVPFASESGEIVYLGLTVGAGARIESIAPLAPEWEAALESDVSRAIARVTAKQITRSVAAANQSPATPAPIDPVISEELLRAFPDLAAQPFDAVAKIMRERTLEEFKIAAAETQAKVTEAQKSLAEAQAQKSEAAVLAAQKILQRVQADQTGKLNGITAQLQERITVLEQLKAAPNLSAPSQ